MQHHEKCWVMFLNHGGRLLGLSRVSKCGISQVAVDIRIILQTALLSLASGIILSHKHPSGDKTIYTEARLAFRENAEGNLTLAIHTIRKEPKLDFPFMGVQFTDEDRRQLRETGNLGRVAEVIPKNGEPFKAFVSVDPWTNELIALKADRIRIPAEKREWNLPRSNRQTSPTAR